jgi:tetratricopeptide (TPR) repeat protein
MEHLPEERARALAQAIAHAFADDVEHLEACSTCRARVFHLVLRAKDLEYRDALVRSSDQTLNQVSRVAGETVEAPLRLSELLALPGTEREVAVAENPRYQTYALAFYALERSEEAVRHDPAISRMLARLGRQIAARTDPRTCGGSDTLIDLEAYALAREANALRVSGAPLQLAAEVFCQARQLQEHSGIDPDLAARIDCLEASLFRDLRQFDKALTLLEKATKRFLRLRDPDQAARAIISRANIFTVKGEFDKAVRLLEGAMDLTCDPRLILAIRHNRIDILAKSGRPQEAFELLQKVQGLYMQHTDPLTTAKRLWVEGLIVRELGEDLEFAAGLLAEAAAHLADHGYAFEAALAGLDLAVVHSLQGETGEVLRIASDLMRLFRVRNLHPEALAALTMVHQAAQQEAASLALIGQAAERVRFAEQARGGAEA